MLEIDVPLLNDVYKTSKDPRMIVVVSAPSKRARRSKGQRRDWLPDGRNLEAVSIDQQGKTIPCRAFAYWFLGIVIIKSS